MRSRSSNSSRKDEKMKEHAGDGNRRRTEEGLTKGRRRKDDRSGDKRTENQKNHVHVHCIGLLRRFLF